MGLGGRGVRSDDRSGPVGGRGPGCPASAVELRVATYNIKAGSGGDNVLDADRTAAAIAETGADGSKGYRLRAWKTELATLAGQTDLSITVCHLPPGTSEWNNRAPTLQPHLNELVWATAEPRSTPRYSPVGEHDF